MKILKQTLQNLRNAEKAVVREKFIVMQTYLKKFFKKPQINNLNLYLKKLEKEEQTKHKVSRTKEIINIKVEMNTIEK